VRAARRVSEETDALVSFLLLFVFFICVDARFAHSQQRGGFAGGADQTRDTNISRRAAVAIGDVVPNASADGERDAGDFRWRGDSRYGRCSLLGSKRVLWFGEDGMPEEADEE
jgi:hypothetical protein